MFEKIKTFLFGEQAMDVPDNTFHKTVKSIEDMQDSLHKSLAELHSYTSKLIEVRNYYNDSYINAVSFLANIMMILKDESTPYETRVKYIRERTMEQYKAKHAEINEKYKDLNEDGNMISAEELFK